MQENDTGSDEPWTSWLSLEHLGLRSTVKAKRWVLCACSSAHVVDAIQRPAVPLSRVGVRSRRDHVEYGAEAGHVSEGLRPSGPAVTANTWQSSNRLRRPPVRCYTYPDGCCADVAQRGGRWRYCLYTLSCMFFLSNLLATFRQTRRRDVGTLRSSRPDTCAPACVSVRAGAWRILGDPTKRAANIAAKARSGNLARKKSGARAQDSVRWDRIMPFTQVSSGVSAWPKAAMCSG